MDKIQSKEDRAQEFTRREMYRKSRDTIRVYNPLNETFKFMWDGFTQSVPAKSKKDMERYLADHYFKKISQKIINDMIVAKTDELVEKKKKTGNSWIDKYSENRELMTQVPSLTDPDLLKKIHDDVILGLVEEYGMELPDDIPQQKTADRRDIYEQILGQDKRVSDIEEVEEVEPKPLKIKPKVEEITNAN